jgi:hypothetical protein
MAIVSIIIWVVVIITIMVRMLYCHVLYRRHRLLTRTNLPPG